MHRGGLPVAQAAQAKELDAFCRNELAGWEIEVTAHRDELVSYRELHAFASPFGEINTMYDWGGNLSNALHYMQTDNEHFFPVRLFVSYPISVIESDHANHDRKGLLTFKVRQGNWIENSKDPDRMVLTYVAGNAFLGILEGIRRKLTEHLLGLLPPAVPE